MPLLGPIIHIDYMFSHFRAGTTYKVNVFGMFDGGESSPLVGQEMTTLSDTTVMPILSSGKTLSYISLGDLNIMKLFQVRIVRLTTQ